MNIEEIITTARLLGAGVWGKVYDADDKSVIKLAKEQGGIGSGREKVLHEKKMMAALAPYMSGLSYAIPLVLECGDISHDSTLGGQGYAIWLHSTKVPGGVLKVDAIRKKSPAEQEIIAKALASALVQFHAMLEEAAVTPLLKPDSITVTIENEQETFSPEDRVRAAQALQLLAQTPESALRPIHGDFNISNILFQGLAVSGVLDFAEMCLGSVEDDICSLTSELPFLRDMIIAEYETLSGCAIDQEKLKIAEMKRHLIGLLICRYHLDRPEEALQNERNFDQALAQLQSGGGKVSHHRHAL